MSAVGWDKFKEELLAVHGQPDRLTEVQARCTELLDEARLARRLLAVATEALKDIALCDSGKGFMPERAQRAYGLIAVQQGR